MNRTSPTAPTALTTLCVLGILCVMALCAALPPVAQAGTRLTYSCFFPPTHVQSQLAEAWCKEVEKRTNGEVAVDFFPGGTLTKAEEAYDGVVQGMSDLGFSVLGYSRGRFPVMAAVDLPLGYRSGWAATQVANQVYAHFKPAEFNDVQPMYFHAHGPGLLHTAKKEVRKLEDLQGLKLRATGNSGQLVKALGGTPVAMSMPDSYQAIQKGVVNGGMYPVETNKGWNMAEVVHFMTETQPVAYTTTFFVVMNKARWESLSPKARQAIAAINVEWAEKHAQAWDASDVVGMEFFKSKGGKVLPLNNGEAERWIKATEPLLAQYVQEAKAKGLDGQAVLNFARQALRKAQQ
ncbi:TRAP transporter substrate-binding protein [Desulfocurvibacter africanus]|uniref:Extracellular solute-binding protein, family 7 n=1 Tax=Desulfocurvibacter africanus subsp. africanus str. Walvis Bay TaxID=690850 RepID=F3YXH7_DESAF|nr:TRAP transporter substrate-binding protein [Desulfocurvibacter africanus]EGJ51754.1 Extracellular solute-binding protein, family 7 [Desulfocurvibacter africanus subsp. africanus str. Walvis Bay]